MRYYAVPATLVVGVPEDTTPEQAGDLVALAVGVRCFEHGPDIFTMSLQREARPVEYTVIDRPGIQAGIQHKPALTLVP